MLFSHLIHQRIWLVAAGLFIAATSLIGQVQVYFEPGHILMTNGYVINVGSAGIANATLTVQCVAFPTPVTNIMVLLKK